MKALVITKNNIENKENALNILTKELDDRNISYHIVNFDCVDDFYVEIHKAGFKNTYDVLISFGGDGTILKSARVARKLEIPILGINAGTLGFLTSVNSLTDIPKALDDYLNNKFFYEERFMLDVEVERDNTTILKAFGVNECTVTTTDIRKTAKYNVSVGDKILNEYRADGIIVATPTGSTAYSLSAGGPIVAPQVDCLILTAICPHAFNQRSIILGTDETVYISVFNNEQIVDIDGRVDNRLQIGDVVKVSKLKKIVKYITFEKNQFLGNVKSKIKSI